jgi:VanZ family protein
MSSSPRGRRNWISAWLPVALGICVVVLESTQFFGADKTNDPFRWFYEAIFGRIPNAQWAVIHHYIRKCGHFLGYGTIGLLWLRALWMTLSKSLLKDASLGLLGTFIVASLDEWHQAYLPNRTGSPWDVLLDCTGAITMLLFVYLIQRMAKPYTPKCE